MKTSLLVLGYRRFNETTKRCLESLLKQASDPNINIYVLDNGSPDNSASLQEEFFKQHGGFISLLSKENLGFAGGMNYLASQTDADWLILIGSDTLFPEGAIKTMIETLQTIPENFGILGPLTNEAGNAQKILLDGNDAQSKIKNFASLKKHRSGLISELYRADFFCVAIRRVLWNHLKGLDLRYGRGYYEDFDFSLRAKALGFLTGMIEDAFVYHQGSGSFIDDPQQTELIKKNKGIFLERFPESELRHLRFDNFLTLKNYLLMKPNRNQLGGIRELILLRYRLLEQDFPRSPFKKLIWAYRVKSLKKELNLWGLQHRIDLPL